MQLQNNTQPNNAGFVNVTDNVQGGDGDERQPASSRIRVWGRKCGIILSIGVGSITTVGVVASIISEPVNTPAFEKLLSGKYGTYAILGLVGAAMVAGVAVVGSTAGVVRCLSKTGGEQASTFRAIAPSAEPAADIALAGPGQQYDAPPPYTKIDSSVA